MQLLSQVPEDFFQVPVIGDLHIVELQPDLGTVTSQRFPDACRLGIVVLPLLVRHV